MSDGDEVVADLAEMVVEAELDAIRAHVFKAREDFIDAAIIGLTAIGESAGRLADALKPLAAMAEEVERYERECIAHFDDQFDY